jgi:hypothetical protein
MNVMDHFWQDSPKLGIRLVPSACKPLLGIVLPIFLNDRRLFNERPTLAISRRERGEADG